MSVLSDKWIKQAAKTRSMIKPFVSKQVRKGKISFGLSSYGYDARVSNEFKIFTNVNSGIVDHKVFKKENLKKLLQIPESLNESSDTIKIIFPSNINAIENLSTLLKVSVEQLKNQSKTMQDISTRISKIDPLDPKLSDLDILFECFLKKHQKKYLPYKKKLIPTKEGKAALRDHLPDFEVLMDRVAEARDMQLRILLLERSSILFKFSQYF